MATNTQASVIQSGQSLRSRKAKGSPGRASSIPSQQKADARRSSFTPEIAKKLFQVRVYSSRSQTLKNSSKRSLLKCFSGKGFCQTNGGKLSYVRSFRVWGKRRT